MKLITVCTISVLTFVAPGVASAQQVTLDAHEHGSGSLAIAVEGNAVSMLLEVPGADIVGFEHAAASADDRALVDAAVSDLARPLALFRFPEAAGCVVQAANVSLTQEFDGDHEQEEHEEHAVTGNAAHKDEHEHEHGAEAGAEHNEFHAEYALACADSGKIDQLTFSYFDRFRNALELDVQIVTANGASAFEVERADPVLNLRGMF